MSTKVIRVTATLEIRVGEEEAYELDLQDSTVVQGLLQQCFIDLYGPASLSVEDVTIESFKEEE